MLSLLLRNTSRNRQLVRCLSRASSPQRFSHYSFNYQNNNNNNNNSNNNNFNYKKILTYGIVGIALAVPSIVLCQECFDEDEDFITQIKTGFKFPKILNKDQNILFNIVNIGNRKLSFININVYSLGFYINQEHAQTKLSEHVTKSKEEFCNDKESIKQEILDKGIGVSLKIRPNRKVTWGHIYGGFQRALIVMLLKNYNMTLEEIEPMMLELKESLKPHQEISTSEQIDFVKKDGDSPSLIIFFNEKPVKEIKDKRLANCFFDFYLGQNSKAPEATKEFYENLWNIFNNKQDHHHHQSTLSPI
ncbi:hypothetical protein DICPUDRAFT_30075 [Dictyostelium purpureum]|uniref:Chalcone isomerase domain-containing protein n=1 Tax=Dictyostelium purpureum TaxID=5786 RepID=F0ZER8_DICPU|nr:uncharacterized protein DICPUDRAFT_30075 [Dictyostelium purpureum]EGC37573.1 hypothetical protein DICPUDRAFT_30075 [Dictyostelium purpureum]|eukprot:XP_003285899.1 hypothetical protein DICPUDRAFT_30075 [Dictyostelium purpureum]